MGNTPSQEGFHHPDEQVRGQSHPTHGHDVGSHANPVSKSSDASIGNFLLERPLGQPIEQNLHRNRNTNAANPIFSPDVSSVPIQFGRNSMRNTTDQPYSMDSLALDTSSMNTIDLSPSSLSPEIQSHEPLGHLTVSNDNFHHPKQRNSFRLPESKDLGSSVLLGVVPCHDSMENQFDSLDLDESSITTDAIPQSSLSSSFSNSHQIETGVDIVTVNGLTVQPEPEPDVLKIFLKCLKKDSSSFVNPDIDVDTTRDKSVVDIFATSSQNIFTPSFKNTVVDSADEGSCKTTNAIEIEKHTAVNEVVNTYDNTIDLAAGTAYTAIANSPMSMAVKQSNDDNSQASSDPGDQPTVKPELFHVHSNDAHTVEIHSQTKPKNEQGFTEDQNNKDCKSKRYEEDDNDNSKGSVLPGNDIVSQDLISTKGHYEPEDINCKLGPEDSESQHSETDFECTQPQFDEKLFGSEMVVVSNLVFVEGTSNEDGEVYTQICLQSLEKNDTYQKQKLINHGEKNIPEKLKNSGDKVFQNQSVPNYYMGKDEQNSEERLLGNDPNFRSDCDSNIEPVEKSTIMSLVLSANRPQFPDSSTRTERPVPRVSQEVCESWDEIEHTFDEENKNVVVVLTSNESQVKDRFHSDCTIALESELDNLKDFNRSKHRESLADFERLEAEISKLEGFHFSLNSSKAKTVSAGIENKYPTSDNQSSCTDAPIIQTFEDLKEEPDYPKNVCITTNETKEDVHETVCNFLEGNYHKSQDREIGEESINFHKETNANVPNAIETALTVQKGQLNVESLGMQDCSGKAAKTNESFDGEDIIDSEYVKKDTRMINPQWAALPLNSLVIMNETKNLPPKTNNERPQLVNENDKVDPHLVLTSHSLCQSANTPNFGIRKDIIGTTASEDCEKIQHISKVYVSTDSEPLPSPLTVTHPAPVDQLIGSDQQKFVHFETEETRRRDKLEGNFAEDEFFIDFSGNDTPKPKSVKKLSKPPRFTSNKKSTILKRKESSKDPALPPVDIVDGSSRQINTPLAGSEHSNISEIVEASREKNLKLELHREKTSPEVTEKSPFPDSPVARDNIMDISRPLINPDSGLESEISSRSTSSSGENNSSGPCGNGWSTTWGEDKVTAIKRRSSSILTGKSNCENISISSGDCSMIFLPQNQSTPEEITDTTNAIFQEIQKRQNVKIDENGNTNRTFDTGVQNVRKPFKPSSSGSFKNNDDNLMSSGVGVGVEKDPTINFKDRLSGNKNNTFTLDHRSSMPEDQENELQRDKELLSGHRGNSMSPSLSNEFMVMNGVTEGHTDTDDISINPVEEALAAQEEQFSRQLQEKENFINELQNNLESLKLKSNSDTDYTRVLGDYEKTMSTYIQKIEDLNQKLREAEGEKVELIRERDQALEDLRNVESAFSDVHRKYERAKGLLENLKMNEETLLRRDQELIQKLQNRDMKIEALKEKAQDSLEQMHLDYENRIRDFESENTKLRAQYRMMEMKLESAERDVEQKAKENAQLSALCDELINGQVIN